eukprot:986754-Amphidinium_carterae.1
MGSAKLKGTVSQYFCCVLYAIPKAGTNCGEASKRPDRAPLRGYSFHHGAAWNDWTSRHFWHCNFHSEALYLVLVSPLFAHTAGQDSQESCV